MISYRFRKPLPARKDKVSIVLVTHKPDEEQLKCTLSALRCQTHQNLEILLVHDGYHKEWARRVSRAYSDGQTRVFMETEHTGCWGYKVRSKYEEMATGDWIGGMCDDDYVTPVYLEELLHAAHEEKADFVQCDYLHNYTEWDQIIESGPTIGHVGIGGWIARADLVKRFPHTTFGEAADGERVVNMTQGVRCARVRKALFVHG